MTWTIPSSGREMPRAIAKAIYGIEYYQDGKIAAALDAFAEGILASRPNSTGGRGVLDGRAVGSGIVVEIARHLSSIKLGRRPWVIGVGLLPAEPSAGFFPVINELDCMIDTEKNNGVMAVWGDLYKNPFTGGFFAVPPGDGAPRSPGSRQFLAANDGSRPLRDAQGAELARGARRPVAPGDPRRAERPLGERADHPPARRRWLARDAGSA